MLRSKCSVTMLVVLVMFSFAAMAGENTADSWGSDAIKEFLRLPSQGNSSDQDKPYGWCTVGKRFSDVAHKKCFRATEKECRSHWSASVDAKFDLGSCIGMPSAESNDDQPVEPVKPIKPELSEADRIRAENNRAMQEDRDRAEKKYQKLINFDENISSRISFWCAKADSKSKCQQSLSDIRLVEEAMEVIRTDLGALRFLSNTYRYPYDPKVYKAASEVGCKKSATSWACSAWSNNPSAISGGSALPPFVEIWAPGTHTQYDGPPPSWCAACDDRCDVWGRSQDGKIYCGTSDGTAAGATWKQMQ